MVILITIIIVEIIFLFRLINRFQVLLISLNKIKKLGKNNISDFSKERFIKKLSSKIFFQSFYILLIILLICLMIFED